MVSDMMTAEQLKDSILQLALQGKLVEQRADEGSARELLSLLSQSKKEYLLNNPVRKMKDANGIDLMETDAEIPDTWRWVKLQDVCLVVFSGKSPVYDKTSTIFKCIGQANNQENGLSLSSIKYVTENFHNSVPEYMFLKKYKIISFISYLILGWIIIFAYQPLKEAVNWSGILLLLAGI